MNSIIISIILLYCLLIGLVIIGKNKTMNKFVAFLYYSCKAIVLLGFWGLILFAVGFAILTLIDAMIQYPTIIFYIILLIGTIIAVASVFYMDDIDNVRRK